MSDMNLQAETSTADNTSASSNPSNISTDITSPKPDKETASLMTLPGELRNRIYRYYFAQQGTALDGQGERRIHHMYPDYIDSLRLNGTDTLIPGATPMSGRMVDVNLLFTCKQAYGEAKGIFLEERLVQVSMHGYFDRYVALALGQALRLELRIDWHNSSPSRPRQFLEILEARQDLQEFTFRIGKEDRALMNTSRIVELFGGVPDIKALKSVCLVWDGAEEHFPSRIVEYHAFMRSLEAIMIR